MAQCKVWLENYHTGQYYPGSNIQGKVVLNFNAATTCRSVKIRLFGHEHTEWMGSEEYTEPGSNETKRRDVLLQGDNHFFKTEIFLYGAQTGTTSLSAGQHIYPFNLQLPLEIPASYNGDFGSISFKLLAIVDRPMAFDYTDELIFVVVSLKDLNHLRKPDLLEPANYSDDKTVCCLCCAQGPITMDISLPKRTLVPEETIPVSIRLTNMSNTNIEGLQLRLKQVITTKVETPQSDQKTNENTLVSLNEVGLGAHGEHTYTLSVKLPSNCTIPNFTLCKLFKVNYQYEVTALLPGVHSNLEIIMHPEVGHIDIGHNAPAGGYVPPPVPTYPIAQPSYPAPAPYPVTQYPTQTSSGYPSTGGPNYPPTGGVSYPPQPFPAPPTTVYPAGASNYPGPPTQSLTGYSAKAQEAGEYPSAPPPSAPSLPLPPTYDSIQAPKY